MRLILHCTSFKAIRYVHTWFSLKSLQNCANDIITPGMVSMLSYFQLPFDLKLYSYVYTHVPTNLKTASKLLAECLHHFYP